MAVFCSYDQYSSMQFFRDFIMRLLLLLVHRSSFSKPSSKLLLMCAGPRSQFNSAVPSAYEYAQQFFFATDDPILSRVAPHA